MSFFIVLTRAHCVRSERASIRGRSNIATCSTIAEVEALTVGEDAAVAVVAVEVGAVQPLVVHNRGDVMVGIRDKVVGEMVGVGRVGLVPWLHLPVLEYLLPPSPSASLS